MPAPHLKLFTRLISRNLQVYVLKIVTLALAFASSIIVGLFAVNEFGVDRFHKDAGSVFRVLERNNNEDYTGNRLSVKIPHRLFRTLRGYNPDSLVVSRVKILDGVNVLHPLGHHRQERFHAVDREIASIFSFNFINVSPHVFDSTHSPSLMLSASAAVRYVGTTAAVGKKLRLYTFLDTIEVAVGGVFHDFPENAHEGFHCLLIFDEPILRQLMFSPDDTGIYGRIRRGGADRFLKAVNNTIEDDRIYSFQPLPEVYFGPRVLGEGARHGDTYSVIILLTICGLIFFLALSGFTNLTTLTLPHRSKELAVRKLAGVGPGELWYTLIKESLLLTIVSLFLGIALLAIGATYAEQILGKSVRSLVFNVDLSIVAIIAAMVVMVAVSPAFLMARFVKSSANRLLTTDTISFPTFKRVISLVQIGLSVCLIIASLVIRRQIDYSLVKEPGQNHDQVVYLNCPGGLTNEGIANLRSGWKKYNPNILDVMAVSQLPDRVQSKEPGTGLYSLKVDRGFRDFFNLGMIRGNWFKVNAGDSIVVANRSGMRMMTDTMNVIGVVEDFNTLFNKPEKPLRITLAEDFNYNWLCVRVLEVDIRRTIRRLSESFSTRGETAEVRFLNQHFQEWIDYQDRLNVLSSILVVISALLSCLAVYGLSISMVRDKLKQIAIRRLHGAGSLNITYLLVKEFAMETVIGLMIFAPVTYILLNELLRSFVYRTKFEWLDPVYPIAYCAIVITGVCAFHASVLHRSSMASALKA